MPGESKALVSGTATWILAADHPAANGHFPGNPIVPGAVLMREIVVAVGGDAARCRTIRFAKFHQPVRPGDTLVVSWTVEEGGEIRFSCSVAGSVGAAVTGALLLSPS
jgi:3-hydroxyacyl-[acyl-carrier-protein] dehydratase